MESSLSVPLPQCDLHTVYGDKDVRHHQTPSTKNHVSCSGSDDEECMASSKLASQPVFKVFHQSTLTAEQKVHGVELDLIQLH